MRVLTLNYEYPPLGGGAAPASEELAVELAARGHEVDIVTMGYDGLPPREYRRGVRVHRVPSLRSSESICHPREMASYLLSGFPKARRLLSNRHHDVIHSHFIVPTGVLAYVLGEMHDVPYYVTAHGSDVPGYNPDRFSLLHRLTLPAWRRIVAGAVTVICPSAYLGRLIRSASDDTTIEVIPNGFNYEAYDPDREKDERLLVTSRLFERKGVQYFLDALSKLETDWDVVITGEGPYREALERRAARLGLDVTFTGWIERSRLEELLETSAVYAFPSSHENCPVALMEAMAAGCAIVASRYSGTREVVGDAGLTVDPTDTSAFAGSIASLVSDSDLWSRLQREARERVERRYGWDRIGTEYVNLLSHSTTDTRRTIAPT